ncbi:ATP-binding protein [Kitasatospora sp. NBC_00240]|uniref:ATP-binding protein n=1 Tax=Kitasatospora sp. NBC_00240 TaxID=2903567 RepID=UPI002256CCEB|nr:ATP-binding protein [Kitasatospora sp. NBC_00240]MCX5211366.1 ATP-binding protein [Kitasatospora sp. NBC_00240]
MCVARSREEFERMPVAQAGAVWTFTCHPESASRARQVLRAYLLVWGGEQYGDDGELVLGELFANAVGHARSAAGDGRIRLHLDLSARGLLIEVSDADGQRHPVPCRRHELADGGRGLAIVAALARWGWRPAGPGSGKTVWALLPAPLPGPAGAAR